MRRGASARTVPGTVRIRWCACMAGIIVFSMKSFMIMISVTAESVEYCGQRPDVLQQGAGGMAVQLHGHLSASGHFVPAGSHPASAGSDNGPVGQLLRRSEEDTMRGPRSWW